MADTLIPVPFMGATLALIEHQGEPYAAMRPIVDGMGLDWASQFAKLKGNEARWGALLITTPSAGGEQKTLCLPVRKLTGWLMTLHPSRAKPELRDRIRAYQEECDDALWSYWTQGKAERAPAPVARHVTPAQAGHGVIDPLEIERPVTPRAFATRAQHYAAQAALLTSHLIEQTEFAGPPAAYALLEAARSSARNTLELIEQAQAEQAEMEGFNHA